MWKDRGLSGVIKTSMYTSTCFSIFFNIVNNNSVYETLALTLKPAEQRLRILAALAFSNEYYDSLKIYIYFSNL